jgi:hypothetical protein
VGAGALVCAGSGSKASNAVTIIVHAARFAFITIASSPHRLAPAAGPLSEGYNFP